MIGTLLSILGIFITYFGITKDNVGEHLKSKKVRFWLIIVFCASGTLALYTDISDKHEETKKGDAIKSLKHDADSLKGSSRVLTLQIDTFRAENKFLHDSETGEIITQITKHDSNTISILAKHKLSIDSFKNEIIPLTNPVVDEADIELLLEPHNCFNVEIKNDSLVGFCIIVNYGGLPAYSIDDTEYVVVRHNNIPYKFKEKINGPDNMAKGAVRTLTIEKPFQNINFFKDVDMVYYWVAGRYYIDSDHKKPKYYQIAVAKNLKTGDVSSFHAQISNRTFVETAGLLPNQ